MGMQMFTFKLITRLYAETYTSMCKSLMFTGFLPPN